MEKNKKMMVVIIALLMVLLAVIVGVSVFAFRAFGSNKAAAHEEMPYTAIETELFALKDGPINVNLITGPDGRERAASVDLSIAVNVGDKEGKEFLQRLEKSEAVVRDTVISVLRDKTYEELTRKNAESIIKEEILVRLKDEFRTNLIVEVYYSNFYHI